MRAKYHGPSSSGSPDILLTRFRRFTMHKSKKDIVLSNIHRILRKVNYVICIMYPNSTPDIMIKAQAVLKLFY